MVIVDDDSLVRRALGAYIAAAEGMHVVGEAEDGDVAADVVVRSAADVALVDLRMPHVGGLEATIAILAVKPDTKVIGITTMATAEAVIPVLRAGAAGYLVKDSSPDEITDAIRAVYRGTGALSPAVTGQLIRALQTAESGALRLPTESEKLSAREAETVQYLAAGQSNGEIARSMHVSEGTVKAHLSNIMLKWNARDRVQVLITAARFGLVSFR
ncbi:response regulator [Microbacterium oleivorans]|uniref:Response regulator transcription factor n=1 Tax=Microbacterium oleivorans TaxID=273677 RepID=A0A7D5EW11_9MICO|nr:response regulator transcription factor [Microbacterium oleivorans]QLD11226.1 response regulator transcription factor [Microbacterium oleivorans]